MSSPLLDGCREKLRRADVHIDELNEGIKRFLDLKPYRLEPKPDPKRRRIGVRVFILKEPPTVEWGALIGETVSNLRSALDQLVWALTIHHQRRAPVEPIPPGRKCWWRQVRFPIFISPSGWTNGHKANLAGIDPRLIGAFHSEQPCAPGKQHPPDRDDLWVLEELWNRDKHRMGPFPLSHVELTDPRIVLTPHLWLFYTFMGAIPYELVGKTYGTVEDGQILGYLINRRRRWVAPKDIRALQEQVDKYALATFDVAFDEGPPAYGAPIRSALRHLRTRTSEIIDRFESALDPARRIAVPRGPKKTCPPCR